MSLSLTVTAGHNFPADIPVTLEALRAGAQPSVTMAGTVGSGELEAGAVTPAKVTPGAYHYAAATFADPAYAVTLVPALAAYANGVEAWIKTPSGGTNTVSSTLNVNGLGAKKIYKQNGELLVAGDMRENTVYGFRYNTTLDSAAGGWQLFTPVGNGARYVTSTGSANAYVYTNGATPNTPTATSLAALAGVPIYFKANFTNTSAATLAVDGLSAKAIRKHGDKALEGGEIKTNQIVCVVYDTTLNTSGAFMLLSHVDQPVVVGSSSNLRVRRHSSTPNTHMVIKADEVILRADDHDHIRVSAVNVTIDITATGAAGRTFATENNDTTYYFWVISKADGAETAVVSESNVLATAMAETHWPADYIYGALVGQVRNNGSGHFAQFIEYGPRWRAFSSEVTPDGTGSGQDINEAHYLGETPAQVQAYARCVTNDGDFTAGDVVAMTNMRNAGGNNPNGQCGANTSNFWFAHNSPLEFDDKDGSAILSITEANWVVYVVADL